jgi:hypothetical protein
MDPDNNNGPVGMVADETHGRVYCSYEYSGILEVLYASSLKYFDMITVPDIGENLAGLAMDQDNHVLYIAERGGSRIARYDLSAPTPESMGTVTLSRPEGLYGLAFDGGAGELYVTDGTWTVYVYSATLDYLRPVSVRHRAYGIAVDGTSPPNVDIYTTGWENNNFVSKLSTDPAGYIDERVTCRPAGVTVDHSSGYVYVTLDEPAINVYDDNLNLIQTVPLYTTVGPCERGDQWTPTDLFLARTEFVGQCGRVFIPSLTGISNQPIDITITHHDVPLWIGGADLLIGWDPLALTPLTITSGQFLDDCGWEYFTYRFGVAGNCEGGCPDGLLRIVTIADLDNGPTVHPSCFSAPTPDPQELARIRFQISPDRNLIGQCVPIRFYWADCGDNTVSNVTGNITYLDKAIYDAEGNLIWDEEDDDLFPEDARPPGLGAPDECLEGAGPEKPPPERKICFQFGRVCIDEPPDDRGDINLNGIANEVGDAVLFSNFFIHGNSVWDPVYQEAQILATDVNDDGIVLTVADLVYLIRIITGDEQAFPPGGHPKQSPFLTATTDWRIDDGNLVVDWSSASDVGAVLLAFDHSGAQFGAPVLGANAAGIAGRRGKPRSLFRDGSSRLLG